MFNETQGAVVRPPMSVESHLLLTYLDAQRDHALGILDGLDDEALRRPMMPSGWSCLAMIQHLSFDIEGFWFRAVIAGEPEVIAEMDDSTNAWKVDDAATSTAILRDYRDAINRSNQIIAATSLDASPAWWPLERFGGWRIDTVRQIILHVLTETACHTGHLDATRELIDGRRWLVLTE